MSRTSVTSQEVRNMRMRGEGVRNREICCISHQCYKSGGNEYEDEGRANEE